MGNLDSTDKNQSVTGLHIPLPITLHTSFIISFSISTGRSSSCKGRFDFVCVEISSFALPVSCVGVAMGAGGLVRVVTTPAQLVVGVVAAVVSGCRSPMLLSG